MWWLYLVLLLFYPWAVVWMHEKYQLQKANNQLGEYEQPHRYH